jgi:RNA polymerase sigma-70 factor (ECF subfamily)
VNRAGGSAVVPQVTVPSRRPEPAAPDSAREESDRWLSSLRAAGEEREQAVARLHALLLRAARFEAGRRRPFLSGVSGPELDDLVQQAADDAVVAVLSRLDAFRGASRFTTWAYKFAIYQTSVALRRRAWQGREVPFDEDFWAVVPDPGAQPQQRAEDAAVLAEVRGGIAALTPHQRGVLIALAVDEVPIDVLAERLGTTRGALYKTLHDARRHLRRHLGDQGPAHLPTTTAEETR